MTPMNYLDLLHLVLPEVIVVIAALCVLSVDLIFLRTSVTRLRSVVGAVITVAGCAAAVGWILHTPQTADVLDGMLVLNPLVERVQIALLVLTMFTVLTFLGSTFTEHVSEYFALILLATVSMMFLVSTQNLLMLFLSIELLSLSLYILVICASGSAAVRTAIPSAPTNIPGPMPTGTSGTRTSVSAKAKTPSTAKCIA